MTPLSTRGLHGHSHETNIVRVAVAEFTGTFILVLAIISTAIAATLAKPIAGVPYGSLAVPLAGGIALAALVAAFGRLSGAHFNPAVTVGLAINRKFPWTSVCPYVASQFLGAITAGLVAWGIYGDRARTVAKLGATYPAHGVSATQTIGAEVVVSFLLVTVIVGVATKPDASPGLSALAIGFALSAAIFISGPLTGAGVNPARAIGPMILAGQYTDWWAYAIGPVVGAVFAVALQGLVTNQDG
jgi:aquaporin Z/aquaporin NIP